MKLKIFDPALPITPNGAAASFLTSRLGQYVELHTRFWAAESWAQAASLYSMRSLEIAHQIGLPEVFASRSKPELWGVTFTAIVEFGDNTSGVALAQQLPYATDTIDPNPLYVSRGYRWFDGVVKFELELEGGGLAQVVRDTPPAGLAVRLDQWYRCALGGVSPAMVVRCAEPALAHPNWIGLTDGPPSGDFSLLGPTKLAAAKESPAHPSGETGAPGSFEARWLTPEFVPFGLQVEADDANGNHFSDLLSPRGTIGTYGPMGPGNGVYSVTIVNKGNGVDYLDSDPLTITGTVAGA